MLRRLADQLAGDPPRGVFGIWRRQRQDDVPEPGVDCFSGCVTGLAGIVVGDRQDDGPGDRGGVTADLGAEAVKECGAADAVADVAAGEVPQVGMLGDHAQRRGGASPDEYRRPRSLDGFGIAERPGQVEVGAVEVERFRLGPQPLDDRARFGEAPNRVGGVVKGQAEIRPGMDAYGLLFGIGNLCAGADGDSRYDARRMAGLLIAGLRQSAPA